MNADLTTSSTIQKSSESPKSATRFKEPTHVTFAINLNRPHAQCLRPYQKIY